MYDAGNDIQNTITAIESVTQTAQQLDSLRTQMRQYEDQQLNSETVREFKWDRANETLGSLLTMVDGVSPMLKGSGLEGYLEKFQTIGSHAQTSIACRNDPDCLAGQIATTQQAQADRSEQQMYANQAAMRNVVEQQRLIREDAANLRRLQSIAQDSQGRMAAIQAGNQLLSAQANNLLQLRAILVTQQQMQAAQAQAQSENDAALRERNRQMMRIETKNRGTGNSAKF
ncbi:IncP-type conjugative transfer protein (plasmid) [Metapseudomonas furukawaii]|uniref:IncP-type conjugative transfer protein n=1 Tax=Metapseudomonas furukawaii TaxID=1149133 RepID=A0AAD1C785_METFU|nr:IncP-type conjugative transfer protein [Pseudomonas furukawaii]